MPVLNEAVFDELKKPSPSNMLLLDVGYFLAKAGDGADREVGKMALLALDPSATCHLPSCLAQRLIGYAVNGDDGYALGTAKVGKILDRRLAHSFLRWGGNKPQSTFCRVCQGDKGSSGFPARAIVGPMQARRPSCQARALGR